MRENNQEGSLKEFSSAEKSKQKITALQ